MTAQFARLGRSFFCADIFAEGIAQGKAGKYSISLMWRGSSDLSILMDLSLLLAQGLDAELEFFEG